MREQLRNFQASDPFGRTWDVEFRWLQNAISIRHADTVDLKYYISAGDERRELVVALPHPVLLKLCAERSRPLTDAWCLRLGAAHVCHMIATWADMDKTLVTPDAQEIAAHNAKIEAAGDSARELAARTR
ncbi:MAG: hypothetical protein IH602_01520 [Bryobacteraceae bacterium]|nr:hypothetical protein [Bryobacteraceae bacterium]